MSDEPTTEEEPEQTKPPRRGEGPADPAVEPGDLLLLGGQPLLDLLQLGQQRALPGTRLGRLPALLPQLLLGLLQLPPLRLQRFLRLPGGCLGRRRPRAGGDAA